VVKGLQHVLFDNSVLIPYLFNPHARVDLATDVRARVNNHNFLDPGGMGKKTDEKLAPILVISLK